MIVEAGYDLANLLFEGMSEPGALRLVALDRDLRLVALRTALTPFVGDLDAAALKAVDAAIPVWDDGDEFDRFAVRYVALGYVVPDVSPYPEGFDWDRVKVVEAWLSRRGIYLLGIQVSDGERFASTGPVHAFESYDLEEQIPRILIIPGPHPFLSCECAACVPRREAWQRARPIEPPAAV